MILSMIQLNREQFGDSETILRKKSDIVENFGPALQNEIDNLVDTLKSWKIGVGISAPQVGIKKKIAIIRVNKDDEPLILINPIISNESGKKDIKKESCLSLPFVRGNVVRRYKIVVDYQDRFGNSKSIVAESFFARVIMHEIDHLNGILFIDRMEPNEPLEEFNIPWE